MIAEPLFAGATHDTDADAFFFTAVGAPGATGAPTITGALATPFAPVPIPFFAATRNVYVVPFVRPVTTCVVAVDANVVAGCAASRRTASRRTP